jgi:hypothetical protein
MVMNYNAITYALVPQLNTSPAGASISTKEVQRFVVLAGSQISAYNINTDSIEKYDNAKDMYFTDAEIIQQPGTQDAEIIRVALSKRDWSWMDVHISYIRKIQLHNATPSNFFTDVFSIQEELAKQKRDALEYKMKEQLHRISKLEEDMKSISAYTSPNSVAIVNGNHLQPTAKKAASANDDGTVDQLIKDYAKKWKDLLG